MSKIEKAYAITDAKISFVSLVDKAANKKQFLITKAEHGSASFASYGRIVNADADSHYITGIVYEPLTEDAHGNYMTEQEITKAVHAASVTLAEPLTVEGDITVAVLQVTGSIPDDAKFKAEVTNNALDSSPVWQDATTEVKKGVNIVFENKTATNGAAFNFRVSVERGESGEGGYIEAVSGAFQ